MLFWFFACSSVADSTIDKTELVELSIQEVSVSLVHRHNPKAEIVEVECHPGYQGVGRYPSCIVTAATHCYTAHYVVGCGGNCIEKMFVFPSCADNACPDIE